jgi:peptidoglycan/LPS O-acetylase OafA/YrhL
MRSGYRKQVACSIALFVVGFLLSLLFGMVLHLVPIQIVFESLSTVGFTWGLLLFSLRRRVISPLLGFYGGLTLELYLMHGFFVNLFYQPFYDMGTGIITINNPLVYIPLVLACGTVFALLFRLVTRRLLGRA